MHPVQVIAVASGKGGVGKTNVSINLACQLARRGQNVLLMDADLGLANVDILLGLRPTLNLSHVMAGECELADILIPGPFGMDVIPAASGVKRMAELSPSQHAALVQGFGTLAEPYDVLIVDTAAGISDSVVSFSRASQHVLVVVTEEPTSLADAYGLIKVLNRDAGITRFKVVCNMISSDDQARRVFERLCSVAERFLDVQLSLVGAIPRDEFLLRAVARQRAVSELYPATESVMAFKRLAEAAAAWPIPEGPRGHIEFFFERLLPGKQEVSMAW
ncbi:MAG: MinD/ParA family protein [Perlucidibaca sp.]